jgi:GNAT superfamily N-acetyltransferase
LDVSGLWSLPLTAADGDDALAVRVVELDLLEICAIKKACLERMEGSLNLLQFETTTDARPSVVLSGRCTTNSSSYHLVATDLRDVKSLENAVSSVLDPDVPTLMVSELVLAYLDESSSDQLLRWCASFLKKTKSGTSCLVLYEPLGPKYSSGNDKESGPTSIVEAYKESYSQHFHSKLDRGRRQTGEDASSEHHGLFFPIGSTCSSVERRLHGAGFGRCRAVLAGRAAAQATRLCLEPMELFDEHAALTLHLSSYVLSCGFPSSVSAAAHQQLFEDTMCPWMSGFGPPVPLPQDNGSGGTIWLTTPAGPDGDEEQLRTLFSKTYEHLFQSYPAIRKMVKSALRKDLSSGIARRFQEKGGDFVVAVQVAPNRTDATGGGNCDRRVVVGGTGLRRLSTMEQRARGIPSDSIVYEIHHLFVGTNYRGGGVGSALLRACEGFATRRQRKCHGNLSLMATTPAELKQANSFYQSCGFKVTEEVRSGDLLMRTYVKSIPSIKGQACSS